MKVLAEKVFRESPSKIMDALVYDTDSQELTPLKEMMKKNTKQALWWRRQLKKLADDAQRKGTS